MSDSPVQPSDIALATAVRLYQQEEGASGNSYSWYRDQAHNRGRVSLGRTEVPARKVGGKWMVEEADLRTALYVHREQRRRLQEVSDDYRTQRLHGSDGMYTATVWGGYTVRSSFHVAHYTGAVRWKDEAEIWRCNICWQQAGMEHAREECHRCSDWSPCGRDCTLSQVFCTTCGTSMAV